MMLGRSEVLVCFVVLVGRCVDEWYEVFRQCVVNVKVIYILLCELF